MPHESRLVHPAGPGAPHAFEIIPLKPRNGALDARCPVCSGYGEWNVEIDLISFRCKRAICERCLGAGWLETGTDPIGLPDIELTAQGHPQWVTRYVPREDADTEETAGGNLSSP